MKRFTYLIFTILCICLLVCGCTNKDNNTDKNNTANKVSENSSLDNKSSTPDKESASDFQNLNLGSSVSLDFVEMTLDKILFAEVLNPTDISSVYSYMSDQLNEKYFYLTGTIKNIDSESYSVENVVAEITFDDKYTYNAYLIADDGGNDFYGDYVKPFGSVKFYLYSSVPDELFDKYSTVTFKFGFKNSFSGSYFDEFDECDYLYQINATK